MLTQLTTIKARLQLDESDVKDDALLTLLATHVSARFERACNRIFGRGDDVYYEFRADVKYILPERYPVESVSKFHLKDNETTGWVEQTDIVYLLSPTKAMVELSSPLGVAAQIGRITYDGGYVLPGGTVGTGQTALPAELDQACVEQVCHLFRNKDRQNLASVSGEGGSVSLATLPDNLLPEVREVLKKYERYLC